MRNEFKAPWSIVLWVITVVSSVLVFASPLIAQKTVDLKEANAKLLVFIIVPSLLVVWGASLLLMIRSYRIAKNTLFIRRFLWETSVDISDFVSAEVLPPEKVGFRVRVLGNGGMFSFSGLYWSKLLGRHRMWVTDPGMQLLITCRSRKIVVSPASPEEFIRTLQKFTTPVKP
jgi:hypothetical protein